MARRSWRSIHCARPRHWWKSAHPSSSTPREPVSVADASHFDFRPGRHGQTQGPPGVTLREITDFGLASVLARKDQAAADVQRQPSSHGVPSDARLVEASASFIWTGPAHWLVLSPRAAALESRIHRTWVTRPRSSTRATAASCSNCRGPRARDVLAKGVSIDLDPAVPAGRCRDHHGQPPEPAAVAGVRCARYRLLTMRTYFGSFWHWFAASAAEYGCEVLAPRARSAYRAEAGAAASVVIGSPSHLLAGTGRQVAPPSCATNRGSRRPRARDAVAVEEPLEIRLGLPEGGQLQHRPISITMRTPGDDFELAAGFLLTEGILQSRQQIGRFTTAARARAPPTRCASTWSRGSTSTSSGWSAISTRPRVAASAASLARCAGHGRAHRVHPAGFARRAPDRRPAPRLHAQQAVFQSTGGLHASALFSRPGTAGTARRRGPSRCARQAVGARSWWARCPLTTRSCS